MNIQLLKKLEGVWIGRGIGVYPPRVSQFEYEEHLTIKPTAKPTVWEFKSATKHAVSGQPMHVEVGYIRAPSSETIELVASHPFGLTEISSGECSGDARVELVATPKTLIRVESATSPFTTGLKRVYEVSADGNTLKFTMDMATSNHPELRNHLISNLTKQ
jgi:hypothetical protein